MKRIVRVIIFTLLVLLVGRNLTFLPTFPSFKTSKESLSLKEKINDYIVKKPGSFSIFFWDLKTNEQFGINEKTVHLGASLNKVPIVATLYHLAGKGEVDLDETVTIQQEDIQDYGTGSIRYEGPGGVYSLKTLARLSMEQSDNTTAHVLAKKIGMDKIREIINSFGLTQTDMINNKTSVNDLGILFKAIYDGKVTSKALTVEFLNFLDDSLFEDRLPHLLPKDVKVYHKTGDEVGNIHDVGIIEYDGKAYFLGVFTDDQKDEAEAKRSIAEISKIVYDFIK